MKKLLFVKMLAALFIITAGSVQAYTSNATNASDCDYNICDGPLDCGAWYIMPKIGAAPGIFAHRGFEQYVVPGSAIANNCVITQQEVGLSCRTALTQQANVFEQSSCRSPKFGQLWHNGVLHVGFEVGRNTAVNGQCFLEFYYDRANGREVCFNINAFQALPGCRGDCNTDCSNFSGTPLNSATRTDCLGKYVSFGAYLGHRCYFYRMWCDRISLFAGVKFGLQHRKAICVTTAIPDTTVTVGDIPFVFPAHTLASTSYCRSNAVSGGIQFGFDYCINDCLSVLVGFEVEATAPFKTNQNIAVAIQDPFVGGVVQTGAGILFPQPTNVIVASTGTFVQFPVWVGLSWEFNLFNNCCNPCA